MSIKIMMGIQKGGVAKSTSTAIMSDLLSASGYKVLVLDLDSQGNTTQMLTQKSIYEFTDRTILEAMKERDPNPYIVNIKENLDLIPSEDMMATFSRYIYTSRTKRPAHVLEETMENLKGEYDFIMMDCPPNLGDIVVNAIHYSDYVITPLQPEPFALDALDRFLAVLYGAQEEGHTDTELLGIAITMLDRRNKLHKQIKKKAREEYGDLVFNSEIRIKSKLKEFTLMGTQMKRSTDVAALNDYLNLLEEVLDRVKHKRKNE